MKSVEEAAIAFVLARATKLKLKAERNRLVKLLHDEDAEECCNLFEDGCWRNWDGGFAELAKFCPFCTKLYQVCIEYKRATQQATGRLNTLTRAVARLARARLLNIGTRDFVALATSNMAPGDLIDIEGMQRQVAQALGAELDEPGLERANGFVEYGQVRVEGQAADFDRMREVVREQIAELISTSEDVQP